MRILVTLPLQEEQKERLREAAPEGEFLWCTCAETIRAEVGNAEIILGNLPEPAWAAEASGLRWIQLNNAGTEGYCDPKHVPERVLLTNATGAYGTAISEHMIGCLFMLRKKLHLYYANQLRAEWKKEGQVGVIEGSRVLCVGLGDIGGAFASRMKALGAYTVGIRRTPSEKPAYVDELYTAEALERELPKADVVALSLPGNRETAGMLDRRRLSMLRGSAVLINVGRGSAVDTDALAELLEAHRLAGAALDVTEPEPLPAGHPLWRAPNALITPHVSGGFSLPETLEKIVEICAENLRRYRRGEELKNLVDRKRGYVCREQSRR